MNYKAPLLTKEILYGYLNLLKIVSNDFNILLEKNYKILFRLFLKV